VGGPSLASGDFAAIAGEAVALATFVTPFPYATDVNAEDFAAAYRRVSRGADPGHLALPAYEATWRVLNALASDLEMERTPSRAAVAAALDALAQEGMLDDRQASTLFIYGFADGGAPRLLP
jgi:ABC-type branched-subunit amino acid transport system substrate-binding protein